MSASYDGDESSTAIEVGEDAKAKALVIGVFGSSRGAVTKPGACVNFCDKTKPKPNGAVCKKDATIVKNHFP